jgi:hypothetical protein
MSVNVLVGAAIAVTSMGIIARACKHPEVKGTPEMSATPNNGVRDNKASVFSSNERESRKLAAELAAC